ncbi:MAG TPA: ABC transporter permease [Gaiellaceae bacterium]|nr:ABC transporter permease [Gaiellaceae bacterium]
MSAEATTIEARVSTDRALMVDRIRHLAETLGIIAIAGALVLAFGLTSSHFLDSANVRNIFVQISVVGVAAIGETLVMLAGGLDLSVGSVVLLSEVICADLTATHHLPLSVALIAALAAAGGIGALNGVLVAVVGIEPILATLGTLLVAAGLAKLILGLRYLQVDHPIFTDLAVTNVLFNLPIMVAVMLGLYLVVAFTMRATPFGRAVYAIGGNRRAARLSGLSLVGITMGVYVIAGVLAGVAGFLNVAQIGLVSQNDGMGMEFQAIIAALVGGLSVTSGGVGRVERTLLGALMVGMMTNYQTIKGIDPPFQQAFLGGLLLAAVVADRALRGRQ